MRAQIQRRPSRDRRYKPVVGLVSIVLCPRDEDGNQDPKLRRDVARKLGAQRKPIADLDVTQSHSDGDKKWKPIADLDVRQPQRESFRNAIDPSWVANTESYNDWQ
jgi:hypothetical protein